MSEVIDHLRLGSSHFARLRVLARMIRDGEITLAGNKKAKIYGTLSCRSGKRLKVENRVFFESETSALEAGYRPCAHCLPVAYKLWRLGK